MSGEVIRQILAGDRYIENGTFFVEDKRDVGGRGDQGRRGFRIDVAQSGLWGIESLYGQRNPPL
jgi:hypothetical protein